MSNAFTTHATNFVDALQTGVDPRTGQFFLTFPVLSHHANHLLGPTIDLSLGYSPLSVGNSFGLGQGISFGGVSVYEPGKRITFSNGESWGVDGSGIIQSRRLKDCTLAAQGDDWVVCWKSGVTEVLRKCGDDRYVTAQIIAPSGRKAALEWAWNGSQTRLSSVRDDFGLLCAIDYNDAGAAISIWPGSKTESCTLRLSCTNGVLTQLRRDLSASESLQWDIEPEPVGGQQLPGKV